MIVTIDPLFNDVSSKQTSIMAKTMILHVAGTVNEYDSDFFFLKWRQKWKNTMEEVMTRMTVY